MSCQLKMASKGEKLDWPREAVKLLINGYECNEFLHNSKSVFYKDRNKRMNTYKIITDKLQKVLPGCAVTDVKKKIWTKKSISCRKRKGMFNSETIKIHNYLI